LHIKYRVISAKTNGIYSYQCTLTLTVLTWTKWRAPTNASKWRMGFNSPFKGLKDKAQ
jgi:hypothetical protein